MKTIEEIEDRIELIYDAMVDLDNQGNKIEADKLAVKMEILEWVIGYKWVNKS